MKDLCIEFKIDDVKFVVTSISNVYYLHLSKALSQQNSYEIHYIPSGYGSVIVDDISYEIGPNTLYTTGPGVFHEQIPNQDEPMSEYGINFDVFLKVKRLKKQCSSHIFIQHLLVGTGQPEFDYYFQTNIWRTLKPVYRLHL